MPEHECHDEHAGCEHEASFRLPPVFVAEAQERFRREATWRSFDTGRYRCRYFEWGSGPPLVFVHGLCDDALSFLLPISRLATQFRCIAYDLAGNGDDGCRLGRYRHADFVSDFEGVLDHLELDRAFVLGSSFGSTIALAAAARRPERFPRVILQGGFARRTLSTPEEVLASFGRYWPWPMENLPLRREVLRQTQIQPFGGREPAAWDYFLHCSGLPLMKAVARRALILQRLDLRPILPCVRQPVLLICGEHDAIVGKACEQVLLENLSRCVRVEIENCGHMPQFSHPEVLAEITRRFLQGAADPADRQS